MLLSGHLIVDDDLALGEIRVSPAFASSCPGQGELQGWPGVLVEDSGLGDLVLALEHQQGHPGAGAKALLFQLSVGNFQVDFHQGRVQVFYSRPNVA